jgi:hypothetical protein
MKKNPKTASISCNYRVDNFIKDDPNADEIHLPANTVFTLRIDYPLDRPASFIFNTGKSGMGERKLITTIASKYVEIYKNEEKYGIWGHSLGDLYIEGVDIDFEAKAIKLHMGS